LSGPFSCIGIGLKPGDSLRTRLKELRARQSVTQDDLAKIVGTRRETILAIENCKYFPSVKLAHDIAKALKTTIDEMYVFDE